MKKQFIYKKFELEPQTRRIISYLILYSFASFFTFVFFSPKACNVKDGRRLSRKLCQHIKTTSV